MTFQICNFQHQHKNLQTFGGIASLCACQLQTSSAWNSLSGK